ncbi:MAG TPA: GGDEF domain-containing protein [Anaeromyxobacteraceae bacterium]|nr:GGDEF domain-containing protein [Anaeromyxobacteraceae bacterium]
MLLISLGLIACVAVGDLLTGTDVNFTLLYLAPIAFGTWLSSLGGGVALSVIASIASIVADLAARQGRPLAPAVLAWNLVVQLGVYLAVVLLLSGFRTRLEGEQLLARTDVLTGVANRRAFFEAAELELERARRHGRPLTLAYVDADDFKYVNDALGHAEGDALLATMARTLRTSTRAVDAVARLGGDEFALLLPETDGPTAQALLARLRATLQAAMAQNGWKVGFSMGAATWLVAPATVDQLMARADELMYEAKRTAKGSIRLAVIGAGDPAAPATTPQPGPYHGA